MNITHKAEINGETIEIYFEFEEWSERAEGLAFLNGSDDKGNEYEAGGYISCGEIVEIVNIELKTAKAERRERMNYKQTKDL